MLMIDWMVDSLIDGFKSHSSVLTIPNC